MDNLIELKKCTEIYYNSTPLSLTEDTLFLLTLITKASRIIRLFDETDNFLNDKNINIELMDQDEFDHWNSISTFFKEKVCKTPHLPICYFYPQPTTHIQNNQNEWIPLYANIDNLFIKDIINPYYTQNLINHISLISSKDLNIFYDMRKEIDNLLMDHETIKINDEYTCRRHIEYNFYRGLTLCFYTQIQMILLYIEKIIQ